MAARDTARGIVDRVTYYDLEVGSKLLFGGCQDWNKFQRGKIIADSVLLRVASIEFALLQNVDGAMRSSVNSSLTCSNHDSALLILSALTGIKQNVTYACAGNDWKVYSCPSGQSAMCVNCDDPCKLNDKCITSGSNAAFSLNPCQSAYTCPSGSKLDVGKVLSITFKEFASAPEILDITVTPSKTAMQIDTLLSGDGYIYCGYYLNSASKVITSQSLIVLQNFGAAVVNNRSSVSITGLMPVMSYDLYCVSFSQMGSALTLDKVIATRRTVSTLCCKTVSVTISAPTYRANEASLSMLQLSVEAPPTKEITIALSARSVINGSVLFQQLFYPSSQA